MRHGIQLELEINELNETEKAVLRSILNEYLKPQHPPAGKTNSYDTKRAYSEGIALRSLFNNTLFSRLSDLRDVLDSLSKKGFLIPYPEKDSWKSAPLLWPQIVLDANCEQLDTLYLWSKTATAESLMDSKRDAYHSAVQAQAKLDARILPLLDNTDADTHVLALWPTVDKEGWTTIRLSHYYDETVDFPTAVINASEPLAALKEYDMRLFEKYGHHLKQQKREHLKP